MGQAPVAQRIEHRPPEPGACIRYDHLIRILDGEEDYLLPTRCQLVLLPPGYSRSSLILGERLLYEGNCLSPGSVVIKKEALMEIGGFDVREEYLGCDDYDLWIRLARMGARFHFINDVLGEFRITGFNDSISDPYHSMRMSSMVKKNIMLFEGQSSLSPRGRGRMAMLYFFVVRTLLKSGKLKEALPYVKRLLQCGLAGITRIGGEVGSRILKAFT